MLVAEVIQLLSWKLKFPLACFGIPPSKTKAAAQGVRKRPFYFLLPSYWGIGHAHALDAVHVIEPSEDEDVLAEEALVQSRLNGPMAADSAIEIRGLRATFKRRGKDFHAVKAPWLSFAKRQLFALLGPNGAGKTTIINMLTGFLPASAGNAYGPLCPHLCCPCVRAYTTG